MIQEKEKQKISYGFGRNKTVFVQVGKIDGV